MAHRRIPTIFLVGALLPVLGAAQSTAPDSLRSATRAALERHVRFLAADSLKGRVGGTAGGAIAAHYIVTSLREANALPGVPTTTCDRAGRCEWTYLQPVRGRRIGEASAYDLARNIVAVVPGSDTTLAGQWVIVGAHTDTYSYNGFGNVTSKDVVVPGADHNASGTAAVIELARRLAAAPLRRPVVFLLYDESGAGTRSFLEDVQQPAEAIVAMFDLHMVGRLHGGRLEIYGAPTSRSWPPVIDSAAAMSQMRIITKRDGRRRERFSVRGIPALILTTGNHDDITGPLDNANRIDYDGLLRVVEFAEQLIRLTGDGVRPWRAP